MLRVSPDEAQAVSQDAVFMPLETPLDMPAQDLASWPPGKAITRWGTSRQVVAARLFVFIFAALLTGFGTYEIYHVVAPSGASWLQGLFAVVFALTFAWIAFSCASALIGFWRVITGRRVRAPTGGALGRNAILMPVYNEDPEPVLEMLENTGFDLAAAGVAKDFDIFILSDTRDLAVADLELHCFQRLRQRLEGRVNVYYRRRLENRHRKAGNIADWVTRWGATYDHMIVLDADSTVEASTLIALARTIAADPTAGIVQSVPHLINRVTLFARIQQFAGRIYGPVVAEGLAAWHGRDGNYWGHNAAIRVKAFAEAAGLELSGRKPFGGHILSHDFVEAALLRRAGYAVIMIPALEGSYEECPPTLIDLAVRDRRWAQGNLQHMKVVGAKAPLGQPGSPDPGDHVLSRLAAVAAADGVRPAPVAAGPIHHARLFSGWVLALPVLAGVRSGAGAQAVRSHHGGAVHAEGAGARGGAGRPGIQAAVGRESRACRKLPCRIGAVGADRAGDDADPEPCGAGYPARARLRVEPAEPGGWRHRLPGRGHALDPASGDGRGNQRAGAHGVARHLPVDAADRARPAAVGTTDLVDEPHQRRPRGTALAAVSDPGGTARRAMSPEPPPAEPARVA